MGPSPVAGSGRSIRGRRSALANCDGPEPVDSPQSAGGPSLAAVECEAVPMRALRQPRSTWPFLGLTAVVTLSACGGGSGQASRSSTTSTRPFSTTPSSMAVATTTGPPTPRSTAPSTTLGPPGQLTTDLVKQTIAEGLAPSRFVIAATISAANSSWAEFGVKPSASVASDTFQSYTGFAYLENGSWTITTDGTAGLNCSALPGQPHVPAAVLQEFGWTPDPNCPGTSS